MKYRIKIITYKNGRKEYIPYFKTKIGWTGLDYKGATSFPSYAQVCSSREDALTIIDKHFVGNTKVQRIDFEYINK